MPNPTEASKLVRMLALSDYTESEEFVSGHFVLETPEHLANLQRCVEDPTKIGCDKVAVTIGAHAESIDDIGWELSNLHGERLNVFFHKQQHEDAWRFFKDTCAISAATTSHLAGESVRLIEVADLASPLELFAARVQRWDTFDSPSVSDENYESAADPTRVVRANTDPRPPRYLSHFLLSRSAIESGNWDTTLSSRWLQSAAPKLALCLVSDIYKPDDSARATLRGPSVRDVEIDSMEYGLEAAKEIQQAVLWVYTPSQNAVVRHSLLVSELSRLWHKGDTLSVGLDRVLADSLASARVAYELHIREVTSASLQAMAELRRAAADEAAHVRKSTRDAVATLWRDFLVFAGALVTQAVSAKQGNPEVGTYVAIAAILFVVISAIATAVTHFGEIVQGDKLLTKWRERLFGGNIADDDFDELAKKPISRVRRVHWIVLALVLVGHLIFIAAMFFWTDGIYSWWWQSIHAV